MNKQAYLDGYMRGSRTINPGYSTGIDTGRPKLQNPDGSFSTEETITVSFDDGVYNIPTIKDGERLDYNKAVEEFKKGRIQPVGRYGSIEEAEEAARSRSERIGRERGNK